MKSIPDSPPKINSSLSTPSTNGKPTESHKWSVGDVVTVIDQDWEGDSMIFRVFDGCVNLADEIGVFDWGKAIPFNRLKFTGRRIASKNHRELSSKWEAPKPVHKNTSPITEEDEDGCRGKLVKDEPPPKPKKKGKKGKKGGSLGLRVSMFNTFTRVTAKHLTHTEQLVWMWIWREMRDGVSCISQRQIEGEAKLDLSGVNRAIKSLVKKGLVSVVRKANYIPGSRDIPSEYALSPLMKRKE